MTTRFRCEFTMDNAAFHDPDGSYGDECARILTELARKARTKTGGTILDVNGNSVGKWSVPMTWFFMILAAGCFIEIVRHYF